MIALMSALLCILGPWALPLPFSPVPLSLCTLGICLAVLVLGTRAGVLCVLLYLLLGLIGLPVFTGFTGGPARLFGPTGGYLLGYLFLALISGSVADIRPHRRSFQLLGMFAGTLTCYIIGTLWLSFQLSLTLPEALALGVLPYLPGDFVKTLLALHLGNKLRKALLRAKLLV